MSLRRSCERVVPDITVFYVCVDEQTSIFSPFFAEGISSASSMDSRTHDLRAVLNMVKSIGPDWRFLHSSVETVRIQELPDLVRQGENQFGVLGNWYFGLFLCGPGLVSCV